MKVLNRRRALLPRALPLVACFALSILAPAMCQTAQTPPPDYAVMLNARVHLMLGTALLPDITQAISRQTGLLIEPAEYLRERRVVVLMDDVSARDALNALAELHDWTWTDKGGGHVAITRRVLLLPQEPTTIPRRMQMALPKDMRACYGIKTPDANYRLYVPPDSSTRVITNEGRTRNINLMQAAQARLVNALRPGIFSGKPYPFTRMTAAQQQDMVASLLFATMHDDTGLLRGDLLPYMYDSAAANLTLNGATMSVMTPLGPTSQAGFGVEIKP